MMRPQHGYALTHYHVSLQIIVVRDDDAMRQDVCCYTAHPKAIMQFS